MFDRRYEVILADTAEARRIHYRLRYQVYCLEEGFEAHEDFPDRMERDNWDDNAVHFIVRCKVSMEWVAAMRLVLPRQGVLPLETFCSVDSQVIPFRCGGCIAEVSRICIKNSFRRKHTHAAIHDSQIGTDGSGEKPLVEQTRLRKSEIMLGLFRAASVYSREHKIDSWYFLTVPAMARLITQMNIQLIKIGSACLHRGKRFPFMANLMESERRIRKGCSVVERMFSRTDLAYRTFSELQAGGEHMAA